MFFSADASAVTHGIQLSLAPVFLLTAVAAMIGAVTGRLARVCVALLTFCSLLIGLTIVTLFLGETTSMEFLRLPTIFFLAGVICFLLALLCFLAETLLATRVLRFGRPR